MMWQSRGKPQTIAVSQQNSTIIPELMQRIIILFALTTLLSFSLLNAQPDDQVLIRINNTGITAGEFVRLYSKNLVNDVKPDFDEYFNHFIIFRLKVAQAVSEGLDTVDSFKREFGGYRTQLASHYLTDNDARDAFLRKAYLRLVEERNASHILIECRPDALPEDTLAAYRKALEIRARILQGEPFDQVAVGVSDDPSVVNNRGNLGWFTALQMIQPFEDMVYSMKIHQLSEPVRTSFGYHIIRLEGIRPSQGRIRVAHIMKAVLPGADEESWNKARDEIKRIHRLILEGASFSELAALESDHRETASRGGELDWFVAGDIDRSFSEAAFAIENDSDISEPVRTPYGWHIIKRLEKKNLGSFNDTRSLLEGRLTETQMAAIARKSMIEKLKKEYHYSLNEGVVEWFVINIDSIIVSGQRRLDKASVPPFNIFEFDGGSMPAARLAGIIEENTRLFNGINTRTQLNRIIEDSSAEMLIGKEDSMLEDKYPEFRYLVKEFYDGMLLFEINSREVWNKPFTDSAGLYKYYLDNKEKYPGKASADAKIYSLRNKGNIKTLNKLVSKNGLKEGGDSKITGRYISGNDTTLQITTKRWYMGDDHTIDKHIRKKGVSVINWKGMESVLLVMKTYQPEPLPYEEVMMEVAASYQDHLDKEWVTQLKKKYSVWVNEKLLEELKQKLNGKK